MMRTLKAKPKDSPHAGTDAQESESQSARMARLLDDSVRKNYREVLSWERRMVSKGATVTEPKRADDSGYFAGKKD